MQPCIPVSHKHRQLRILDKLDLEGNDWGGTTIMLVCEIYEHEMSKADPATPGV